MAGMTLTDIQTFVRTNLDTDATDLPDVVLNAYIREGYRRVIQSEKRWPFFEALGTFSTVAKKQDYDFSKAGFDTQNAANVVDDFVSLQQPNYEIMYRDAGWGDRNYPPSYAYGGPPQDYSIWNNTIRLYPTPDAVYKINIRYYRKPNDFVPSGGSSAVPTPTNAGSIGAYPDCPEDFHELIAIWASYRSSIQQTLLDLADFYKADFDQGLTEAKIRVMEGLTPENMVLNGSRPDIYSRNGWLRISGEGYLG